MLKLIDCFEGIVEGNIKRITGLFLIDLLLACCSYVLLMLILMWTLCSCFGGFFWSIISLLDAYTQHSLSFKIIAGHCFVILPVAIIGYHSISNLHKDYSEKK